MNLLKRYSFLQVVFLVYSKIRTFFLFKEARMIRFPFRVRGKKFIEINKGFTTGFNCRLDAFDFNDSNEILIKIGENVEINDDVHIAAVESVVIENDVLIASKVYISDHNHGSYKGEVHDSPLTTPNSRKIYTAPILIKKNVWLGEFVCVLQGVTIGEGSIIGAMSVVSKDIPPYSIAVGSPAKVIKKFDFDKNEWVRC
ncbi:MULTISPECIES: acetyltransferase [unclassified Empedobacter]|uniref:acetyltransferase n=1 Tax=unclassified Empedobacter TaxID=2643773 RepID=UPI0025BC5C66|nr:MULTISPECIES: acetyltransferase [unclassified Empedobacter]